MAVMSKLCATNANRFHDQIQIFVASFIHQYPVVTHKYKLIPTEERNEVGSNIEELVKDKITTKRIILFL